jgi:hypothetical protein
MAGEVAYRVVKTVLVFEAEAALFREENVLEVAE